MNRKKPARPYWEMTTKELREATAEFDQEFVADQAKPLTPEMERRWERAKAKQATSKNGVGQGLIASYLRRRLEHLHSCYVLTAQKVDQDKMALADHRADKRYAEATGRILYHLEYGLSRTFRYTLLIGVCSFVEESVRIIAKERIPDEKVREQIIATVVFHPKWHTV